MAMEAVSWMGAVEIAAAVAFITLLVNRWVDERDRSLARATEMAERFDGLADRLLDDPRTPFAVSAFIVRLSREMGSFRIADWVVKNSRRFYRGPSYSEFSNEIEGLPADLKGAFAGCVFSALAASAASHPFLPGVLSRQMASTLTRPSGPDAGVASAGAMAPEPVRQAAAQYMFEHPERRAGSADEMVFEDSS